MTRYVGVDLHRRRSVIVVLDEDGAELWTHRIDNDPLTLGLEIEMAGPAPEVVLEATWGWYWAADVITEAGGRVHLAHPLGVAGYENRRVKNDQADARLRIPLGGTIWENRGASSGSGRGRAALHHHHEATHRARSSGPTRRV